MVCDDSAWRAHGMGHMTRGASGAVVGAAWSPRRGEAHLHAALLPRDLFSDERVACAKSPNSGAAERPFRERQVLAHVAACRACGGRRVSRAVFGKRAPRALPCPSARGCWPIKIPRIGLRRPWRARLPLAALAGKTRGGGGRLARATTRHYRLPRSALGSC